MQRQSYLHHKIRPGCSIWISSHHSWEGLKPVTSSQLSGDTPVSSSGLFWLQIFLEPKKTGSGRSVVHASKGFYREFVVSACQWKDPRRQKEETRGRETVRGRGFNVGYRKHQPNRGCPYISADPHSHPASSGYEALPTVSNGDSSSTQHWALPQLQRDGSCSEGSDQPHLWSPTGEDQTANHFL